MDEGQRRRQAVAISPPEYAFAKPGQTGQLHGRGHLRRRLRRKTSPPSATSAPTTTPSPRSTPLGEVKALRPGDTAVIVSYRGNVLPVRVLVPMRAAAGLHLSRTCPRSTSSTAKSSPSCAGSTWCRRDLSSDDEFLRRVTIDTIGTLPTPEEVRAFLADTRPDKRTRKIDELLAHPLHAALWATKFCDITGNNTDCPGEPAAAQAEAQPDVARLVPQARRREHALRPDRPRRPVAPPAATARSPEEYIKDSRGSRRGAADKGFDARPTPTRETLDLFWRRQQPVTLDQWGEKTAAAFLGVRLECAECHKHPFDRWTQADYRAFANIFAAGHLRHLAGSRRRRSTRPERRERKRRTTRARGTRASPVREVFVGDSRRRQGPRRRRLPHPETASR